MDRKDKTQGRKVYVTIRSPAGKKEKLETWRYWEIVGELQFMGATRVQAVDAAKWCIKAKPGEFAKILISETDEIMLEVKEW